MIIIIIIISLRNNKTIILFTHSKSLIDMADFVYRVKDGQIIA